MFRSLIYLTLLCLPSVVAAQTGQSELQLKILRDLPDDTIIGHLCCSENSTIFPAEAQSQFLTHYGEGPIWVKIEGIERSGLIQFTPVLDEVVLFARTMGEEAFLAVRTGDLVPNLEKVLPTAFMALPLPQDVDPEHIYAKIVQPTKVAVEAMYWSLPTFAAMQDQDRITKTFLLGFICAIILYNVVVSILVRDPVFFLNAACIASLMVTSLYLSGYGVVYFWANWSGYSNVIFYGSIAVALLFAGAFFFLFLYSGKKPVWTYWPLFISPAIVLLAGSVLLLFQAPYWMLQITMLICAGLFFAATAPFSIFAAIKGDPKARIILIPIFFAMVPGLSLVALDKLLGYEPFSLGNNSLEITLAVEAILFSLAIASRIRVTETENAAAANQIIRLRERNSKMALIAQDNERKRLAKELHDGVGQEMLVVVGRLKKIAKMPDTIGISQTIDGLVQTATQVLDNMRRISRDMHPASIDHLGFAGTVQATIDQMNTIEGIQFKWDGQIGHVDFNKDAQLHLIRMIQECFSNVSKHAQATKCDLSFITDNDQLVMCIQDDGIGLKNVPDGLNTTFGLGLTSLNERVNHLKGRWIMESNKDGGLTINMFFPLTQVTENPGELRG